MAELAETFANAPDTSTSKVGKRGVAIAARKREIAAINKAARDVKDEGKAIDAELFELAGGAKYATYQGVVIATRTDSHSTIVDTKTLLELFPEAHAACVKEVPYSYYKV